jgi:hypothetical protein
MDSWREGPLPYLPNAVHPTLVTTLLFTLLNTFYQSPMAYFNTNNANFYSTSPAFGEPDAYPFLSQMSAIEGVGSTYTYGAFTDQWGMVEQSGPTAGSSTSLATAGYGKHHCIHFTNLCLTYESPESAGSAAWLETQTNGYGQPSYTEQYWPAVGQQAQPYHSGFSSHDSFFANTVAPETSTAIPAPSSGKSLFSFETSKNKVLTNCDQSRSTTGGSTRADPRPARPTW